MDTDNMYVTGVTKFRAVAMFVIPNTKSDSCLNCSSWPGFNGLFDTAIKPGTKFRFYATAMLLFHILQRNRVNESFVFFKYLVLPHFRTLLWSGDTAAASSDVGKRGTEFVMKHYSLVVVWQAWQGVS
jgi:hypothetical protein